MKNENKQINGEKILYFKPKNFVKTPRHKVGKLERVPEPETPVRTFNLCIFATLAFSTKHIIFNKKLFGSITTYGKKLKKEAEEQNCFASPKQFLERMKKLTVLKGDSKGKGKLN